MRSSFLRRTGPAARGERPVQNKPADLQAGIAHGLPGCLCFERVKDEGPGTLATASMVRRNARGTALDAIGGNGTSVECGGCATSSTSRPSTPAEHAR